MKQHTTNYYDTLITVAADSTALQGTVPPRKVDKLTIANLQFDLLTQQPDTFTSDDALFMIFASRQALLASELAAARTQFFSKGQPCLRTSPLAKNYGWGILFANDGKIRLVDSASPAYQALLTNTGITKIPAMKSKK